MATSYFRERARNPYLTGAPILEDARTQENPIASPLSPTFSRPMPMAPIIEAPPPRATAPTVAPSPFEVIEKEREAYAAGAPTSTKGKILQALAGAGLGFLRGAASNRDDPLGAGIGGAAAGGVISAVSPGAGRSMQFEMVKRPQIEERLRGEEDKRKRTMEAEDRARSISMDDLKRREGETRIKGMEAETRARRFENVPAGTDLYDTETRQTVHQGQARAETPEYGSASGVGIFNRRTGQVTTPAAPRQNRAPNAAYERLDNLNELRQNAIDWWTKWGQLPPESPERQNAEKQAQAAQANYNAAVEQFGTTFGEWFETGPGRDGWHFVQPRRGQTQSAAPATKTAPAARSSQPTANLKELAEKHWR